MLKALPDELAALIMPRFHAEALSILNQTLEASRARLVSGLRRLLDSETDQPPAPALFPQMKPARRYASNVERADVSWRPVKHAALLRSFYTQFPEAKAKISETIFSYPANSKFSAEAYEQLKAALGLSGKHSHWLTAALRDLGCRRTSANQWYTPSLQARMVRA